MGTLLSLPAAGVIGGCASLILVAMALCFASFGGSAWLFVQDFAMIALTEIAARVAFRSPLDVVRLRGQPLFDWSLAAGTALAVIGIFLNHLALDSRAAKSPSDRGSRKQ